MSQDSANTSDKNEGDLKASGWQMVVMSGDVGEDDVCPGCGGDYSECPCPGPTMDDHEYIESNGKLWARPTLGAFELINTFTGDQLRPTCPICNSPIETPDDPTKPFTQFCLNGHMNTFQYEEEGDD